MVSETVGEGSQLFNKRHEMRMRPVVTLPVEPLCEMKIPSVEVLNRKLDTEFNSCGVNADSDAMWQEQQELIPRLPKLILDTSSRKWYRLGKFLGKGGFAHCYQLEDTVTKELFAVKVIPKFRLTKPSHYDKIYREIRLHREMDHKHIVHLYSAFEDDSNFYMVLEYCVQESLFSLMKSRKELPESEARYFLYQCLLAVHYMHDCKRVLHRDLKLGNMLLTYDRSGHVVTKLADFGMADVIPACGSDPFPIVCGTPNYISPEVLKKAGHSFASESWAIGCILYAFLTGRPPFETETLKETYMRIQENRYDMPPHLSYWAKDLIRSMLSHKPQLRPTALEALRHPFLTTGSIPAIMSSNSCHVPLPSKRPSVISTALTQASTIRQTGYPQSNSAAPLSDRSSVYSAPMYSVQRAEVQSQTSAFQPQPATQCHNTNVMYDGASNALSKSSAPIAEIPGSFTSSTHAAHWISSSKPQPIPDPGNKSALKGYSYSSRSASTSSSGSSGSSCPPQGNFSGGDGAHITASSRVAAYSDTRRQSELRQQEGAYFSSPAPVANAKRERTEGNFSSNNPTDPVYAFHYKVYQIYDALTKLLNSQPTYGVPVESQVDVVCVTRWIDHTNRHGFGCQYSDESLNVMFNDGSRLALTADGRTFQYLSPNSERVQMYHAIEQQRLPVEIHDKVIIFNDYRQYMQNRLTEAGAFRHNSSTGFNLVPYVYYSLRLEDCIFLLLSNGTMQVNFFNDHTKVMVGEIDEEYLLTFVDENRVVMSYQLSCLPRLRRQNPRIWNAVYILHQVFQSHVSVQGRGERFYYAC